MRTLHGLNATFDLLAQSPGVLSAAILLCLVPDLFGATDCKVSVLLIAAFR